MDKSYRYDKVIEFFSEHETAIYGLGPTDYGAEEGTLLWCIKELDSMFDINRDKDIKQRTLKVICALIDIYEEKNSEDSTAEWFDKEVRGSMTNVCSRCGADSIYPTKYCGNCGISMRNGY